jgi:DNA-binding NtrC family response regulator
MIVSADWQTRALLAAQLGEASEHTVVSAPGVNEALGLIKVVGMQPVLLIVDAGPTMATKDVERLLEGVPGVPLVLCVSALRHPEFDSLRERSAAYLTRPVSIGEIAQAAARVLQSRHG